MHYKCHKISLKHGGSYIDSPDWIKNKKATVNSINDDNKCFKSWRNRKKLQDISKIKPFINKYNWKRIIHPSGKDEWKTIGKSNPTTALNVLCIKKMNIHHVYISKHDLIHKKQVILLMIVERWRMKDGIILQ